MSQKRARRARQKRNRAKIEYVPTGRGRGAPEWGHVERSHLELTCRTLDHLVGLRNRVLADLRPHLSDEHKRLLSLPLDRLAATSGPTAKLLADESRGET